jgi:hypothetical protein
VTRGSLQDLFHLRQSSTEPKYQRWVTFSVITVFSQSSLAKIGKTPPIPHVESSQEGVVVGAQGQPWFSVLSFDFQVSQHLTERVLGAKNCGGGSSQMSTKESKHHLSPWESNAASSSRNRTKLHGAHAMFTGRFNGTSAA